jgi:hypothetical protein
MLACRTLPAPQHVPRLVVLCSRAGCWHACVTAHSRPACPSSTTAGPPKCAAYQHLTLLSNMLTALHELDPRAAASAMPPCTPWTPPAASFCTWRPRRAWCTRAAGRWGCGPPGQPLPLQRPASARCLRWEILEATFLPSNFCYQGQWQPS